MNILSIESSCDEMAVAVIANDNELKSSVVSSQIDVHEKYGGVVPELAGRHHLELVNNVVAQALEEAGMKLEDIDLFAGTRGPGLSAALLVGTTALHALWLDTNCRWYWDSCNCLSVDFTDGRCGRH